MARGWESKSVEEQMANALGDAGPELSNDAKRRVAALDQAVQERQRQSLNLQRENILSQRTSNPARRAALEAALAQVEAQLAAIG
jgi:hypothetical protein